eukprot:scaffold5074_cov99-Cylindrotheca_fusiformis.AAC.11
MDHFWSIRNSELFDSALNKYVLPLRALDHCWSIRNSGLLDSALAIQQLFPLTSLRHCRESATLPLVIFFFEQIDDINVIEPKGTQLQNSRVFCLDIFFVLRCIFKGRSIDQKEAGSPNELRRWFPLANRYQELHTL